MLSGFVVLIVYELVVFVLLVCVDFVCELLDLVVLLFYVFC